MDDFSRENIGIMALNLRRVTFAMSLPNTIEGATDAEAATLLEARGLIEQAINKLAGLCPDLDVVNDPPPPMSRAERRRDAAQSARASMRRPGR